MIDPIGNELEMNWNELEMNLLFPYNTKLIIIFY